jgi:hypothetical protein
MDKGKRLVSLKVLAEILLEFLVPVNLLTVDNHIMALDNILAITLANMDNIAAGILGRRDNINPRTLAVLAAVLQSSILRFHWLLQFFSVRVEHHFSNFVIFKTVGVIHPQPVACQLLIATVDN